MTKGRPRIYATDEEREKAKNARKRERRRALANALGRKFIERAKNGHGRTKEEKMKRDHELRRIKAAELAQKSGKTFKLRGLHDAHVKAHKEWIDGVRHLPKHDAHVKDFRKSKEYARRKSIAKYHSDPKYCIYHRIKRWMHKHLKDGVRSTKWSSFLGYTTEELKTHIERQFEKGMGWHNKGEWHIDHIVPVASFNIDSVEHPDFRTCFGLPNLRPVWAKENMKKADKITLLL